MISDITEKGTTMTTREIDRESFEKAKQLFISGEWTIVNKVDRRREKNQKRSSN